jgi:hypothetical protein
MLMHADSDSEPQSKHVFQAELNYPAYGPAEYLARPGIGEAAIASVRDCRGRITQVEMIESIQRVAPQLQTVIFGN